MREFDTNYLRKQETSDEGYCHHNRHKYHVNAVFRKATFTLDRTEITVTVTVK